MYGHIKRMQILAMSIQGYMPVMLGEKREYNKHKNNRNRPSVSVSIKMTRIGLVFQ